MNRFIVLVGALSGVLWMSTATPAQTAPERLLAALRNADAQAIQSYLSDSTHVNTADEDGVTALMYAAMYADPGTIKRLLAQGAQVNARSKAGVTALMLAVGNTEKVRLLLASGAEVNIKSPQGHTALDLAAGRVGASAVVRLLLNHQADLTSGNALAAAARCGDVETVKQLLAKGADPDNKNRIGGVPAASAKRVEFNRRDGLPRSPFLLTPPLLGSEGTPLMYAVYARNSAVVKVLLGHGAQVNARSNSNGTALMLAAQMGDSTILKLLLEQGAEVNAQNDVGYSALLYAAAAEGDESTLIKALLAKGAAVNTKAKDGQTPLMLASRKGKTEIVRLLEQAGAKE